jgi:hypothetical protein
MMELLETTPIPWAQGVVSSNLAAPTNKIIKYNRFSSPRENGCSHVDFVAKKRWRADTLKGYS